MALDLHQPSARLIAQRDLESTRFRKAGNLDISQGPRNDRRCTDVPCCFLFIASWLVLIGLFIMGLEKGDPQLLMRFIRGKDVLGHDCGVAPNEKFPLTYFTVPMGSSITGSTPKQENLKPVCTSSCPNGGKRGQLEQRPQGQCPEALDKLSLCTWYGGSTTRIANFCFDKDVFNIPGESWQAQLQSVKLAWPVLIAVFPLAVITGYLFLFLIRWCAGAFVWAALLSFIAFFGFFGYDVYLNKDTIAAKHGTKTEYVAILAYVLWALAALILLFSICLCRIIQICVAMLKTASLFLRDVKSQIIQPLIFTVAHLVFYACWVVVAVYVVTIGMKSEPQAKQDTQTLCFKEGNPFCVKWTSKVHIFAMMYLLVMLYWGANFLHAISKHGTAYAVGVWYFAPTGFEGARAIKIIPGGGALCNLGLTLRSICLGVSFHMGSLAFGSFVVTLAQIIRLLFFWAKEVEGEPQNPVTKCLFKIANCLAQCLERFLRFLSGQAYIQVALTGKGFCESCGIAFAMFARHPLRFGFVYKASLLVEFLGVVIVSGVSTLAAYLAFEKLPAYILPTLASPIAPLVAVGVGSAFIGMAIMHPFSTACSATMHCFVADEEMEVAAGSGGAQHTPAPLQRFVQEHCS